MKYYCRIETREREKTPYWFMFALSALFFATHYWLMAFKFFELVPMEEVAPGEVISGLIGAVLFGYASYGLHRTMVKIRHQTE